MATSKWRRPEDARGTSHLIGPNAILQLVPLLERLGGPERVQEMMASAGLFELPDGTGMIPQEDAARLHRQLRREEPDLAPAISAEAGRRTADYILAHRIPPLAQAVLKILPPRLAAQALSGAIRRHAWTFAGSGRFRVVDPWHLEIAHNPVIQGEHGADPLCHWHAAVFARLYQVLVARDARCTETVCAAQGQGDVCRFEITSASHRTG